MTFRTPNVVSRLSDDDYRELRAILCPYCAACLPDGLIVMGDSKWFEHYIPHASQGRFICEANAARLARDPAPSPSLPQGDIDDAASLEASQGEGPAPRIGRQLPHGAAAKKKKGEGQGAESKGEGDGR